MRHLLPGLAMLSLGAMAALSPESDLGAAPISPHPSGEGDHEVVEGASDAPAPDEKPEAVPAKPAPARARAKPAAAEPDDGLVEAIVRRGTVVTGTFADPITVGPGGTVRLAPAEVRALRADGVLVDPDGVDLPAFQGPTVGRG